MQKVVMTDRKEYKPHLYYIQSKINLKENVQIKKFRMTLIGNFNKEAIEEFRLKPIDWRFQGGRN